MVAIPKAASTVVLIDEHFRVYLTKRPLTMKFMGGFHVFPGGAMDEGDNAVGSEYIDATSQDKTLSIAHYVAGARELFEEVGILLGKTADNSPVHLTKEKKGGYRRKLLNREITFYDVLEQESLVLDLQYLTYFGQIITPEQSPIRFDTRFFLAKLPDGQQPDPDPMEIDEAYWIHPEEALSAFDNKIIKLAPPTIVSLRTLMKYRNGGALTMSVSEYELLELLSKQKR